MLQKAKGIKWGMRVVALNFGMGRKASTFRWLRG